jgi:misacylated tRNA(Ala) deacylase
MPLDPTTLARPATELIYATDAYRAQFDSEVIDRDETEHAVALAATAFFPTGGGQPHDTGTLQLPSGPVAVTSVSHDHGGVVWHTLFGGAELPDLGTSVSGVVDWDRRYALMRMHTALHVLNGVIWVDHAAHVTGAHMTPEEGRLDFELPAMSQEFAQAVEARVNEEICRDRPVEVRFMPRSEADADPSVMRLKANLIPRSIDPLRVIEIVGLDRQADGGTHVRSTREIGAIRVVKTQSKGKANKRIKIALQDGA